jgi:hypothetical protein
MKTPEEMAKEFFEEVKSGIVTLCNWTMFFDGEEYLYVFCRKWTIFTDKMNPLKGFHNSAEKWQLVGLGENGEVVALIPGCQVKGFVVSDKCPRPKKCFELK